MPASTSSTSAPASSHSEAISFVNDSLRARNALAPFLMISAASTSTTRRGASIVSYRSMTAWSAIGSASSNRPMTIRVGRPKSSTAVPWRRNSGLVKTRAVGRPVASTARRVPPTGSVLRMTRMSSGPNRSRDRGERAVQLAEVARPSSPIGVPTHIRMIPGSDGTVSRDVETAGGDGGLEPLLEAVLVDRDVTGPERGEPGGAGLDDVDAVAEPGEPDGADETDIAGADDGERTFRGGHRGRAYQSSADAGR